MKTLAFAADAELIFLYEGFNTWQLLGRQGLRHGIWAVLIVACLFMFSIGRGG